MPGLEELNEARDLLKQWSSISNDTIYTLVRLKSKIGYAEVLKFLRDELNPSPLRYSYSPEHLMRLITVGEMINQRSLSRSVTDKLPLATWQPIMKYVSRENTAGIVEFLYGGGTLNKLKENFANGLKMEFNNFSGKFEFYQENTDADCKRNNY